MTVVKSYTCNLCRRSLNPDSGGSKYPEGWALTWTGPGQHMPGIGARLEPIRSWDASPIHLCQVCVQAVAIFRTAAAAAKELQPETVAENTNG